MSTVMLQLVKLRRSPVVLATLVVSEKLAPGYPDGQLMRFMVWRIWGGVRQFSVSLG
ncbi:hypothetical protein [Geotalea uraniireducens]|uniref:hypothetical protein n=1 Tax=Geotalea uraniireducens TaxID=351604 RepID=UPI0024930950|nr:hypothetical protein [Geotalea uraniireducens]